MTTMESAPPDSPCFAPGATIDGKYLVERRIAQGGIGVVVEAHHLALDQRVAIKYLKPRARQNPSIVERFEREARLTALMKSEHVVRVQDVGSTPDGGTYIVMELLDGKDLGAVIEGGCVPIACAVDWVLQACDALAEAHSLHIVHRDIKPENLFLAEHPGKAQTLKIIDFGISKMPPKQDRRGHWSRETATNERFGTPLYMSPEQLQSSVNVDARSDIWSLGAVLFELLTGTTPFLGDDLARLCTSILMAEPRKLRELCPTAPEELEHVIARCLEKRPELRYRNVAELAQDLLPFGPPDTAPYRVVRVRDAVTRSGRSIRPPTPSQAMDVNALRTLAHATMDSVVLPRRRPSRAIGAGALLLGVLAVSAIAFVRLRSGPVPAAQSVVVGAGPRTDVQSSYAAPLASSAPTPVSSAASAPIVVKTPVTHAIPSKRVAPSQEKRSGTAPAASANPRALFGERQ